MIKEVYEHGRMVIEFDKKSIDVAKDFMDKLLSAYQNDHPCPDCGSHNVEIDIDVLGEGYVCGSEWCNDCGWTKITDTFPEEEE